tara:strand:+ start:1144 stop:1662 length:519 start_codon:yes stop_codon:yes gene_type:complete
MPFWSEPTSSPKLSFRWYASFGVGPYAINTYCLRSFQKPSFEIVQSEYIWLNDINYKPGLLAWNPVEITVSDMENKDDNNTWKLYNILKRSGYQDATVTKPRAAFEKKQFSRALGGQMKLTQINADGEAIEEWTLINPFLIGVNFGQANYGAEEIITLSLSIRYDYAQHSLI